MSGSSGLSRMAVFRMRDRLAILSGERQAVAETPCAAAELGLRLDGAPEGRDRLLGAPFHHRQIAERDLPPGIAIVERDRANGVLAAGVQPWSRSTHPIMGGKHQTETPSRLRAGA